MTLYCHVPKGDDVSVITFGFKNSTWVMKITDEKIIFNPESIPFMSCDEFAKEVLDILLELWVNRERELSRNSKIINRLKTEYKKVDDE